MSKRLPNVLLSEFVSGVSEEPSKKIRKNNRKSSKSHGTASSPKLEAIGLCDLPSDLLEKIIGNINIWHHNRIRGTSKRLRHVNDVSVMHEFRKALHQHTTLNPTSYESAALKIIQYATELYVRSGFGSTFCGCILPMLRSSYKDPFCPQTGQIKKFLIHFYDMVDEMMDDQYSQQSRLLYNLTLMQFFSKFDKFIITSSTTMPLYWQAVIELQGPWIGTLWTSKTRSRYHRVKRNNMLVILSEMLIANITGKSFKRVWECLNEIYVFGNDTSNGERVPKTFFTITVHGSKDICSFFRSCLEHPSDQLSWPSKWPRDQFTVNLDIMCQEATKWGCSKTTRLEFSPFTEPKVSSDVDHGLNL